MGSRRRGCQGGSRRGAVGRVCGLRARCRARANRSRTDGRGRPCQGDDGGVRGAGPVRSCRGRVGGPRRHACRGRAAADARTSHARRTAAERAAAECDADSGTQRGTGAAQPAACAGSRGAARSRSAGRQYTAALEARSLPALKQVWPGLGGGQERAIKAEFGNARQISVTLDSPRIQVSGDTATVVATRRYSLTTVDGHELRSDTRSTFQLRAADGGWIIESVRFEQAR